MSIAVPPPEISGTTASVLDPRPAPTHLDAESAGMRMTVAEFEAVETWDRSVRFELIRGVVAVSPAVSLGGRYPRVELMGLLRDYARTKKGRKARVTVLDEHDLRFPDSVRRADLAFWVGVTDAEIAGGRVPTVAVEFVSKGRRNRHRDFVEKRAEYLAAGVSEYWIFDRFGRSLTVCTTPEGEAGRCVLKAGEVYRTDLMPGFELPVDDLLREADRAGE